MDLSAGWEAGAAAGRGVGAPSWCGVVTADERGAGAWSCREACAPFESGVGIPAEAGAGAPSW